ncbi:PREDICTED: putative riboflavin kinase isoform X1 [Papilio xuthus]|uniref:riboflavin kinase n=2 Tax=Papilio xuthus TaxID=66420 RepID=A0AAJ6Z6B6_PAPXU|nr:PREDICTED: putative riboflavin kinase isoform X1 [Papilio xuthus]
MKHIRGIKKMTSLLPFFMEGEVVKGFGRGSKELGCPTANYSLEVVKSIPKDMAPGVYYGWAQVDSQMVHKMVANIGWCPFYENKEMSVETHVMHKFDSDFYGSNLKICVIGYLRPEKKFDSLNDLIEAIQQDIKNADAKLDEYEAKVLKEHKYFNNTNNITV